MIDVTNPRVYQSALHELNQYRRSLSSKFMGRFVQLFLGMKFYQNELPSMFSNQFVSTEVLQTLLDDLYSKASKPLNQCVLNIFENRYLARTGLKAPGNKTTQNTWRNNFNLQKGVGCYAPPQDLTSQVFLNQRRLLCRHLQPLVAGTLAGASCQLCVTGATYRNEDHRKWLRIDPGGAGYAVVDLMNVGNFLPYVSPAANRIPIVPLIVALYHDASSGLITGSRKQLDIAEFASDFNFSTTEVNSYFDQARTNQHNQQLANQFRQLTYNPLVAAAPMAIKRPSLRPPKVGAAAAAPSQPVLSGTPVTPPGVNTGWEAEQYVATALRKAGWTVYDVSRQRLGYDLLSKRGKDTRYIDVKSSLGLCSPTLTAREWQQAKAHARSYVLAIVENFNSNGQNSVYWVPDPANACTARAATMLQYSVARGSWAASAVTLANI